MCPRALLIFFVFHRHELTGASYISKLPKGKHSVKGTSPKEFMVKELLPTFTETHFELNFSVTPTSLLPLFAKSFHGFHCLMSSNFPLINVLWLSL